MTRYAYMLVVAFAVSALCWLAIGDDGDRMRCSVSGGRFMAKTFDVDTGFVVDGTSVDRMHVTFCVRGSANVMRVLEGSHVY